MIIQWYIYHSHTIYICVCIHKQNIYGITSIVEGGVDGGWGGVSFTCNLSIIIHLSANFNFKTK